MVELSFCGLFIYHSHFSINRKMRYADLLPSMVIKTGFSFPRNYCPIHKMRRNQGWPSLNHGPAHTEPAFGSLVTEPSPSNSTTNV